MNTQNLIHLIGLQRCGCHAVANWLLHQYPTIQKPYELKECPNEIEEQNSVSGFNHHNLFFLLYNQFWFPYQEPHAPTKVGYTPQGDVGSSVIVYETGQINRFNLNFENKEVFGQIKNERRILVLRDILNCCASWYKMHHEVPQHIMLFWYHRYLEITGRTNYIPNKYFVSYNEWFLNKKYREKICEDLDLTFTDVAINSVPNYGNGSSFSKREANGDAQLMGVMTRWKWLLGDKDFRKAVKPYRNLIPLSEEIFGKYDEDSIIFSTSW